MSGIQKVVLFSARPWILASKSIAGQSRRQRTHRPSFKEHVHGTARRSVLWTVRRRAAYIARPTKTQGRVILACTTHVECADADCADPPSFPAVLTPVLAPVGKSWRKDNAALSPTVVTALVQIKQPESYPTETDFTAHYVFVMTPRLKSTNGPSERQTLRCTALTRAWSMRLESWRR